MWRDSGQNSTSILLDQKPPVSRTNRQVESTVAIGKCISERLVATRHKPSMHAMRQLQTHARVRQLSHAAIASLLNAKSCSEAHEHTLALWCCDTPSRLATVLFVASFLDSHCCRCTYAVTCLGIMVSPLSFAWHSGTIVEPRGRACAQCLVDPRLENSSRAKSQGFPCAAAKSLNCSTRERDSCMLNQLAKRIFCGAFGVPGSFSLVFRFRAGTKRRWARLQITGPSRASGLTSCS